MIEGVEEFRPELQIPMLGKPEVLKEAQVDHLDARTMELSGSTGAKGSRSRLRKCRGIDKESRSCI